MRYSVSVVQHARQLVEIFLAAHVEIEQRRAKDGRAPRVTGTTASPIEDTATARIDPASVPRRDLADGRLDQAPDGAAVQFRPTRLGALRIVFAVGRADQAAFGRKQRDLAAGRARVDAEQNRHGATSRTSSARLPGDAEVIADQLGRPPVYRVLRGADTPGGALLLLVGLPDFGADVDLGDTPLDRCQHVHLPDARSAVQHQRNPGHRAQPVEVIEIQARFDLFHVLERAGNRAVNAAHRHRQPVAAAFLHEARASSTLREAPARREQFVIRRQRAGLVAEHRAQLGFARHPGRVGEIGHLPRAAMLSSSDSREPSIMTE